MKQVKFLLLAAFVAMFTGCQNEEIMEQDSENRGWHSSCSKPLAFCFFGGDEHLKRKVSFGNYRSRFPGTVFNGISD